MLSVISSLSFGSAVRLLGSWQASQGHEQSHELRVSNVQILGDNDAENSPLQPKYQTAEYLRTVPHLRPRIPVNALLLRLRSQVIACLTRFFNDEGFVQTHTPVVTSSDCEGAGEVFTVRSHEATSSSREADVKADDRETQHFFRKPNYLTVSAQLHLEALAQAVNKVWTLSPTFRAEKSDTSRHLSEFYMLEAEICFTDNLHDIMDLVEQMLRTTVIDLRSSKAGQELLQIRTSATDDESTELDRSVDATVLSDRWNGMASENWPRISYQEAIDTLKQASETSQTTFRFAPSYDEGLQAEHERFLAEAVGKGKPIFVTDYPKAQKPFYMAASTTTANNTDTEETVACFDLLVPDLCELAGGSLREHRSKQLLDAMKAKGVAGNDLEWYQDLRKYGSVPHGGFGLGFDRLLCYLSGVSSVRDMVSFPRWYGRCDC